MVCNGNSIITVLTQIFESKSFTCSRQKLSYRKQVGHQREAYWSSDVQLYEKLNLK